MNLSTQTECKQSSMDKVTGVHDLIENLVHVREKKNNNLIKDLSKFTVIPNEYRKKQKEKGARSKQKKRMSRKEYKDLGLYSLPRKTLKYADYKDLNDLWNSYMEQQLGSDLKALSTKLNTTHSLYEQTSAIIHKSDFHGAKIKVSQSKCASLVGIKGIVILDTKGTFNVIGKDNVLRVIPKSESIFELKWKSARFMVFGKHLAFRSADRSVKKIKSTKLIDL